MTVTAKIIADSVSPDGIRLTTLQCRYPKFIHGELMTHRVFSRNASSSRAIPVARVIEDVMRDPVVPIHWGANQKGMQADAECDALVEAYTTSRGRLDSDELEKVTNEQAWLLARDEMVEVARRFNAADYHKQIVNRLIEPWCHINVVVTATEWSNFFALRCHPAAQPEMRMLAECMQFEMYSSTPRPLRSGEWHLPYVRNEEKIDNTGDYDWSTAIKLSVARCARVSYLTQDGKEPNIAEDLALYDRLVGQVPLHASPAEHQATPDEKYLKSNEWRRPELHGNFRGWIQYRKTLKGESQ